MKKKTPSRPRRRIDQPDLEVNHEELQQELSDLGYGHSPFASVPPTQIVLLLEDPLVAQLDRMIRTGLYGRNRQEVIVDLLRSSIRTEMRAGVPGEPELSDQSFEPEGIFK